MKKSIVAIPGLVLFTFSVQAQEDGAKLAKAAGRALTSYNIDPANNKAKLDEAKAKINQALQSADAQALASAWITQGDIYNTILQKDMAQKMIDPNTQPSGDNDALIAFNAYKKGYELADKKFEKKDAAKGVSQVQGHLVNIGANKYEAQEYGKAYDSWKAAIDAQAILKEDGTAGLFDDADKMEEQEYYTAIAASLANNNAAAGKMFEQLIAKGTKRPGVYEGLYQIKLAEGDTTAATQLLSEGRKKFPNDTSLLFAEINSYLSKGKLDELVDKLKEAISKEPDNVSLYITLGNVFDNLYSRELNAGHGDEAQHHFDEAKSYYQQAIAKDPNNVDAVYSLGALFYNKAAYRTKELNAMSDDFSQAALKKAEEKRQEVLKLFDDALPYFQKAESLNPNDMNTLIALNEIFARKEDFEKVKEFKARLETVKNGGSNENSYFKK